MDEPLRMFLVVRRGAIETLERAGELAGAAAVACLARYAEDPDHAELIARWRPRPGKVALRARGGQWAQVLAEPHALAGAVDSEAVLAIPPRPRAAPGELLPRLQALSAALIPPQQVADPQPVAGRVTYLVNPTVEMSSGKTLAQIAHAAVMASEAAGLEAWVAAGCPARVVVPSAAAFGRRCADTSPIARVQDAGLTEVAPGTLTVLALAPT